MRWEEPFAIKPPEHPPFPPYVHYSGEQALLSGDECRALIGRFEDGELGYGTIGNGGNDTFREDHDYRCARVRAVWPAADDMGWLFERVRERVVWVNRDQYRFDLSGMNEGMQFLRYEPASGDKPAGHYNWHQDFGGGYSSHRKLSIVIQLSDPADYDGCRLRLFTDCEFDVPCIGQGDMVVFPAWTPHCVTPITRGLRRALVCWVSGPQFR